MRIHTTLTMIALLGIAGATGCRTTIQNHPVGKDEFNEASMGIPWVEPRLYDVFVYQRTAATPTDASKITQVYYGQHYLLDEVSGTDIDIDIDTPRRRWQTNYSAWLFADGSLTLTFDGYGSLKKAEVTSKTGMPRAAKASAAAAGTFEGLEEKKLERMETELEILETKKKTRDARKALEGD